MPEKSEDLWNKFTYLKTLFKRLFVWKSVFGANKRPFVFHEVIDLGGEPIKGSEYTGLGRVTEFKYGMHLSNVKQFPHWFLCLNS